jgi:ectoine hydroxylase-related dioxygenase (phytanoyl-CoA dioxygenase family)
VRVEDGTLLLFPAYLDHSVGPNESPDVRISVSFNVMCTDYAETMSPPLW